MVNAGEDIDSYCGKCRLLLAHVVIATEGGLAVRVQCKTCQSPHNHRAPKAERSSASKRTVSASKAKTAQPRGHAQRFRDAIDGRDISRAQRYSPKITLAVGDVIDHQSFGLGVVSRLSGGNKAHVAFSDAERTLICGREQI